jgi:DNA-binding CsgD family transcriptional regulator
MAPALSTRSKEVEMRKLTMREIQIVRLAALGHTAKEIAKIIGLEYRTIESYMTKAKRKLAAKNVAHAVFLACQMRVLQEELA